MIGTSRYSMPYVCSPRANVPVPMSGAATLPMAENSIDP